MQLSFDAADRLVELVQAQRGPVPAGDAARVLFALASTPTAIARGLLDDVVREDARLRWRGADVALAGDVTDTIPLEHGRFVVFDLETTGLSPRSARICEIGAQRVDGLELADSYETLVDPGVALPPAIAALTGIGPAELRGAPSAELAVRRFLDFAADDVLVAHNARFDLAFLDRHVEPLTGRRVAAPVVDTVWLARRLLATRTRRFGLGALAEFFGTSSEPCHRALPDARATAEILVSLIGLAQERGARTVADLVALSAPRARRLHSKRSLVAGAPSGPGVYLFRGKADTVLYVGRARDLRTRLRAYFSGGRQRPAVEAALSALECVEWRPTGSELEAALVELRLIRELRPPANARSARPDRYAYLRRRGSNWAATSEQTPHGPIRSRRLAQQAVRALAGHEVDDPAAALPLLRSSLRRLARDRRFEDAARLRDRVAALEDVVETLEELRRLRSLRLCLVAPALEPGFRRAFFVSGGRVAAVRSLPPGAGASVEALAGLGASVEAGTSVAAEDADELLLIGRFLRRPPPELRVLPLDLTRILAA